MTGSPLLQFLCYLSGLLPSSPLAFHILSELLGSILPSAGWPHPPVHFFSQDLTGRDGGWVGVGGTEVGREGGRRHQVNAQKLGTRRMGRVLTGHGCLHSLLSFAPTAFRIPSLTPSQCLGYEKVYKLRWGCTPVGSWSYFFFSFLPH